jgi:hypothetical protein
LAKRCGLCGFAAVDDPAFSEHMSRVHDWDRIAAEERPFRLAPPIEKSATLSVRQIWVGSLLVDIGPALLIAGALTFLRGGNGIGAIAAGVMVIVPSEIYGYRVFRGTVDPTFGPGSEYLVQGLEHTVASIISRLRS